jgi:two-component system, OmpR family, sensor histidine kinase KdpD
MTKNERRSDLILRRVEEEERRESRGELKVFLGYASGVGKSYRMLDEARRRKQRGEDVVVGAAQPVASPEVEELLCGFELIPPRTLIDIPAVLKRKPETCLIDALAHDNYPGALNPHRWQDVEELLRAGINVITTVNIQYIKERQSQIQAITGKIVSQSVPEGFIKQADEIEIVDAPPEYAVTRSTSKRADVETLTRELSELREIAFLLAAEVVDYQLEQYMQRHGIEEHYGTHERVLVGVTPRSNAAVMLRRARRQADRFHGELHAVYVEQDELTADDRRRIDQNLSLARELGARVEVVRNDDPVQGILHYAKERGITQIFVGHSQRRRWLERLRPNPVERLILEAEGIDLRIFPNVGAP